MKQIKKTNVGKKKDSGGFFFVVQTAWRDVRGNVFYNNSCYAACMAIGILKLNVVDMLHFLLLCGGDALFGFGEYMYTR